MLDPAPRYMSRLSLLIDLASLLGREVDLDSLLATACERVAEALRADRASIWLVDAERGDLVTRVALLPEVTELRQPMGKGIAGVVAESGKTLRVDDAANEPRFDPSADRATGYHTQSLLVAAIREHGRAPVRGVIQLLNRKDGPFDAEDELYLEVLAQQLARALSLTTLRAPDESGPGLMLRGPFNRIIGRSPAMRKVYERVGLAAQTDATVLLSGETGTGKGLFARAIHVNSPRQGGPFVTVDCTTLPAQLVESELFGHERGAFTGAERRVRGKVELAHEGTLFLDEVGELPVEMQGKLLRFLQDRVYERVGGRETLRADVRLVCATHRDLEKLTREGKFREDLFFRMRVVVIDVPPLRARGADEIEILARHFAEIYAERYGRPLPVLEAEALDVLRRHHWPGNVRELEHWVESAVVLSPDGRIAEELWPRSRRSEELGTPPAARPADDGVVIPPGLSLDVAMQHYMRAAVAAAGGNKTEAAKRLGVGRNTVARALKK
ncbi:MAG: sigma-54-dependent Fis family transcriptional regulator [Polyangiaceae bacterium]